MAAPRRSFSLRFENEDTHQLLRILAGRLGVSMNELAEDMIERQLDHLALGLEEDLAQTMRLLRQYRGQASHAAWAAFANAEGTVEDPIKARKVEDDDPFGIAAAFAR